MIEIEKNGLRNSQKNGRKKIIPSKSNRNNIVRRNTIHLKIK